MNTPLENVIAKRFGILPNFFRLASSDPQIAANLWGFAQFAYLDNPLPSLFKERLFVYLSRFCEVRSTSPGMSVFCGVRPCGRRLFLLAAERGLYSAFVAAAPPARRWPAPIFPDCAEFDSPPPRFLSQTAPENRRSSRARHTFSFRLPMHRRRTRRCGARSDRST